jgi:hypothetical protein
MYVVIACGLIGAIGGAVGYLAGFLHGRPRAGKWGRRALTAAGGGGIVVAILSAHGVPDPGFPAAPVGALAIGLCWALFCEACRAFVTRRVERDSAVMGDHLADHPTGSVPGEVRDSAAGWPRLVGLRVAHRLGLSDLSDAQFDAYAIYRAQVAWNGQYNDGKSHDRPDHWSFYRWVWHADRWLLAVAVVGTAAYLAAFFLAPTHQWLIQALVVLVLLLGGRGPLVDPTNYDDAEAARLFHRYWCGLFGTWVLLYVLLFWARLGAPVQPGLPRYGVTEALVQFLANLNTLFLVLCFVVLRDPPSTAPDRPAGPRRVREVRVIGGAMLAAVTLAECACTWREWREQILYFRLIGGAAGGVALALLVGRLESKALSAPVLVIVLLYLYAVLQGAMTAIDNSPDLEQAAFLLALPLKCVLFLFINWVLGSGRLMTYIRRVRELDRFN